MYVIHVHSLHCRTNALYVKHMQCISYICTVCQTYTLYVMHTHFMSYAYNIYNPCHSNKFFVINNYICQTYCICQVLKIYTSCICNGSYAIHKHHSSYHRIIWHMHAALTTNNGTFSCYISVPYMKVDSWQLKSSMLHHKSMNFIK